MRELEGVAWILYFGVDVRELASSSHRCTGGGARGLMDIREMTPCPNQALTARVTFEGIIKRSIVD